MKKTVVLCILDGVGYEPSRTHNAVAMAKMPFFNGLTLAANSTSSAYILPKPLIIV